VSGTRTAPTLRFTELGVVLFVFFVSGASGLIYEVVWTRMLTLVFGGTVFAVSAVLTSFMLGLGAGSLLGGRYSDRIRRRRSLLIAYGMMELAIAGLAFATPILFSVLDNVHVAVLSHWDPSRFQVILLRFCLALFGILLPTSLMGATLPLLSRYLVTRNQHIGLRFGILYSVNTAGAVAGCTLSGFVLIASYGVTTTLSIAAAGNIIAGILALLAARWTPTNESSQVRGADRLPADQTSGPATGSDPMSVPSSLPVLAGPWAILIVVSGLSGFVSLGYQVLWSREFSMLFTNTVYGFTVVVSTFLVGLVLGGLLASAMADRVRNTLAVLAVLQVMIGVTAIFLIDWERRRWLSDVVLSVAGFKDDGSGVRWDSWTDFMMLRFVMALLTMLLPATLIGVTFPLLVRAYTYQRGRLGSRVGGLYCANTVGCVLGAAVVGFVMIPLFGIRYSVLTLGIVSVAVGIVLAILDPVSTARSRLALISVAVILLGTVIVLFDPGKSEPVIAGARILLTRDSVDALVRVEEVADPPYRALIINYMRRLGGTSRAALQLQRRQAHLPMLLHPNPQDVLVIGFATGCTTGAVAVHNGVRSIDGVEIVGCLEETAAYFSESNYNIVADPRFRFHAQDGRNFVRTTRKKYDVIIVDLFQASDAGVGNLYTIEHFQSCRDRLKPGGLICQWIPTHQLPKEQFGTFIASFQHAFPNSTLWMADVPVPTGLVGIVGSTEPLHIDYQRLSSRFAHKALATVMANVFLEDEFSILSSFLLGSSDLQRLSAGAPLNTDDRPLVEYLTPRDCTNQKYFAAQNLAAIASRLGSAARVADRVDHLCPEEMSDCESAVRLRARLAARSLMIFGLVMSNQNRVAEAIDYFQKARSACPDSREVEQFTQVYLQQLNNSLRQ